MLEVIGEERSNNAMERRVKFFRFVSVLLVAAHLHRYADYEVNPCAIKSARMLFLIWFIRQTRVLRYFTKRRYWRVGRLEHTLG